MSQFDKLILKILAVDSNLRFEELQKVLEHFHYELDSHSSGGSHCTFRKEGAKEIITIPKHRPIKKIYVQRIKQIIEGELDHEEAE